MYVFASWLSLKLKLSFTFENDFGYTLSILMLI